MGADTRKPSEVLREAIGDGVEFRDGVPMPELAERGLSRASLIPWETMQVGQSFLLPLAVGVAVYKLQPILRSMAARKGIKLGMRRTVEGLEVWRVADDAAP